MHDGGVGGDRGLASHAKGGRDALARSSVRSGVSPDGEEVGLIAIGDDGG